MHSSLARVALRQTKPESIKTIGSARRLHLVVSTMIHLLINNALLTVVIIFILYVLNDVF